MTCTAQVIVAVVALVKRLIFERREEKSIEFFWIKLNQVDVCNHFHLWNLNFSIFLTSKVSSHLKRHD